MKINFFVSNNHLQHKNIIQDKSSSSPINQQTKNSISPKQVLNFGIAYIKSEDIFSVENQAYKTELKKHLMNSLKYDEQQAEEFASKVKFGSEEESNKKLLNDIKKNTRPDNLGNLAIHLANLTQMQEIHKIFEDQPELLKILHTAKNNFDELPIHFACLEEMQEINRLFADQPEFLKILYIAKDCDGNLPINFAAFELQQEIIELVKNLALEKKLPDKDKIELLECYKDYDTGFKDALEYLKSKNKLAV